MPCSAQSLSRRRIVRSEHPAVAIRSYPLPCTNAATTCSNTTRSGTRRRWQPSGWPGSNGGRSAPSSARNSTQIGSSRHDGTAGTGHLGDHWTLDKPMIINPVPVPCNDTHGSPLLPGVLSHRGQRRGVRVGGLGRILVLPAVDYLGPPLGLGRLPGRSGQQTGAHGGQQVLLDPAPVIEPPEPPLQGGDPALPVGRPP